MAEIRVARRRVIEHAGRVGHGNHVLNDRRGRIYPTHRNRVVWEGVPLDDAIHDMIGRRIKYLIQANHLAVWIGVARRPEGRTEISITLVRGGHDAVCIAGESALTELLEAKEEEGPVVAAVDLGNIDRAAQRDAI